MISKVKTVQGNGTFESQYGADLGNGKKGFFKFEYLMEDGQVVNANHKTKDGAFKVGDEVEYEITNKEYNNGKVKKPNDFKKGGFDVNGQRAGHAVTAAIYLMQSGTSIIDEKVEVIGEANYLFKTALKVAEITEAVKSKL